MPAHPFLLVAMVRDDGARAGYKRGSSGKGFSRGRREVSAGKALPEATLSPDLSPARTWLEVSAGSGRAQHGHVQPHVRTD